MLFASTAICTAASASTGARPSPNYRARCRRWSTRADPVPRLAAAPTRHASACFGGTSCCSAAALSPLTFEQVPFDHPLWVLYSSGTTGLPKPIVQGHGGILLEHLKSLALQLDLKPDDRFFWFTTTGWMMWNFLVSGLLRRLHHSAVRRQPGAARYWRALGVRRAQRHDLLRHQRGLYRGVHEGGHSSRSRSMICSRLRAIGSTGSPLPLEGFQWVYEQVKADSGWRRSAAGRIVCTAFVGGCPLLPVYAGEIQCRSLGAAVHAFDEHGSPVIDQVGELVITAPMPSMPLCFWNDPDGRRYRESYFEVVPGRLAPWRLVQNHHQRHGRDLWSLRRHDQPHGHSHGHQRDLPRGRGNPRGSRQPGGGSGDAGAGILYAAVRGARRMACRSMAR